METKWQQKFIKADKISKTFILNIISSFQFCLIVSPIYNQTWLII